MLWDRDIQIWITATQPHFLLLYALNRETDGIIRDVISSIGALRQVSPNTESLFFCKPTPYHFKFLLTTTNFKVETCERLVPRVMSFSLFRSSLGSNRP